jgi:beta-phosphoglucomutase
MSLQAIVLDFDGVIADTEPAHLRAFQEELAGVGLTLSRQDYLDRYLGYTDREVFEMVTRDNGAPLPPDAIERLVAQKSVRLKTIVAGVTLVFPGVADRVREWSKTLPVAIASGALRGEIEAVLDTVGIRDCFQTIVSADDPVQGKPSPEPYQLALSRVASMNGLDDLLDPASCVAIEDSRWGIVSAKAAGMRVVGVTSSYPASALRDADCVVESVAAVSLDLLKSLAAGPAKA